MFILISCTVPLLRAWPLASGQGVKLETDKQHGCSSRRQPGLWEGKDEETSCVRAQRVKLADTYMHAAKICKSLKRAVAAYVGHQGVKLRDI